MTDEATITINGHTLTRGQAITIRLALNCFETFIADGGLGTDHIAKQLALAHTANMAAIAGASSTIALTDEVIEAGAEVVRTALTEYVSPRQWARQIALDVYAAMISPIDARAADEENAIAIMEELLGGKAQPIIRTPEEEAALERHMIFIKKYGHQP